MPSFDIIGGMALAGQGSGRKGAKLYIRPAE